MAVKAEIWPHIAHRKYSTLSITQQDLVPVQMTSGQKMERNRQNDTLVFVAVILLTKQEKMLVVKLLSIGNCVLCCCTLLYLVSTFIRIFN